MGWQIWYSVMFAFVGFPGDKFREGESLLEVWCLYLNAENADSSLTLSYLRASSPCINILLGMPIGAALRPDLSPSTCLGENLSKSINHSGAAI